MILTLIEHDEGEIEEACLEALSLARTLAEQEDVSLTAIAFTPQEEPDNDILAEYGVSELFVVSDDALFPYAPGGWATAIDEIIEQENPTAVVAAGIERSQEVLARVGAIRQQPMAANCNEVTIGEPYEVIRQRWGGSLLEEATLGGDPKLLSVTPHETSATPADEAVDLTSTSVDIDLADADMRVQVTRIEDADIEGVPLGEARVVVGGGRGVGSSDDFDQLEALADHLGGTVGASRAAVNEGWRPHDDQIGLTGAKISPELYIAAGISGAVQHWVGAKGSKHILAINTDGEAAIIQKSDWAVIGDLHEVVPAILAELDE